MRQKHKQTPLQKAALFLVFVGVIFVLFVFAMRLDAMQVKIVSVEGAHVVSSQEIENLVREKLDGYYFLLIPHSNIFFYPGSEASVDVAKHFPRLDSVKISIGFDKVLHVVVHERVIAYSICEGVRFSPPCFALDAEGYIFDEAPSFSGGLIPLFGYSATSTTQIGAFFLSRTELARTEAVSLELARVFKEKKYQVTFTGIRVTPDSDYEISLSAGGHDAKLFFRAGEPVAVGRTLALLLGTPAFERDVGEKLLHLNTLDLRFGNKVYYTSVGGAATSTSFTQ